jgi:hypothetical protein
MLQLFIMLSVVMPSAVMLCVCLPKVVMLYNAFLIVMLSVIVLSVFMLSVIMLSVVLLNVVMLCDVFLIVMLKRRLIFIVMLSVVMLNVVAPLNRLVDVTLVSWVCRQNASRQNGFRPKDGEPSNRRQKK